MSIAKRIYINNDIDIITARIQVREAAKQMGFGTTDQARISLAVSELARMLSWKHSHRSEIILSNAHKNGHQGIQVVCLIDLEYLQNGELSGQTKSPTTSHSNLTGARKLVDESDMDGYSSAGGMHPAGCFGQSFGPVVELYAPLRADKVTNDLSPCAACLRLFLSSSGQLVVRDFTGQTGEVAAGRGQEAAAGVDTWQAFVWSKTHRGMVRAAGFADSQDACGQLRLCARSRPFFG
jgi:hypothetical protein